MLTQLTPAPSELAITISQCEQGIRDKNLELNLKTKEYVRLVEKRADAERNWLVAFEKKLLESDDLPVTLRKEAVKGDKEVSKLKLQYEICLGIERANLEGIKNLRQQIDILRSFLSWHKSEKFPSGV